MQINGFDPEAVKIHVRGKREEAHVLYFDFWEWTEQFSDKLLAGQNIGHLDLPFLEHIHTNTFTKPFPFPHRTLDLHSVAFTVLGKSLSHADICEALGLPTEPKPHHALHGARSERDAFKKLFEMQAEGGKL